MTSDSTKSVVGVGTFASNKAAEGVDITTSEEIHDDHSIASSSISNSSTVAAPLSPDSHASLTESPIPDSHASITESSYPKHSSKTESLIPNSHALMTQSLSTNNEGSSEFQEQYHQENVLNPEQEVLQTYHLKNGSAPIQNTAEHETRVNEESVTGVQKQQAQSRLNFSRNFQTVQFTEDENVVFEPLKKKNRKNITRRKKLVDDEKCDEGNDSFEVDPSVCCIGDERSNVKGHEEGYEELHKEKSYEGNYIRYKMFVVYM